MYQNVQAREFIYHRPSEALISSSFAEAGLFRHSAQVAPSFFYNTVIIRTTRTKEEIHVRHE